MVATTKPNPLIKLDPSFRLADAAQIASSIYNMNNSSSTYGIVAAGTTQATATQLNSVYNEVDTVTASTGVNLPLSTGGPNVPYQFTIVINNGANSLSIYGAQGSSDTINGVAGSTALALPVGASALFNSAKGGAWFTGDVGVAGSFAGNITETLVGTGFVQKASATGAGRAGTFNLNGATAVTVTNTTIAITDTVAISLNTAQSAVGAQPHLTTISAGVYFTVVGTANDTSTYNYSIFGVN
jgi:hypothetical protein